MACFFRLATKEPWCVETFGCRFRIPIVSAIPDPLNWIPDSEAQESIFHKQKFLWFRNPDHPSSRDTKRIPRIQLSLNFSLALLPKNAEITMTWVNFKVFNYLRGYINTWKSFSSDMQILASRSVATLIPFGVWISYDLTHLLLNSPLVQYIVSKIMLLALNEARWAHTRLF